MKILHIGNLENGIDAYMRNTVALASDRFEFVIVKGAIKMSLQLNSLEKAISQYFAKKSMPA